MRACNQPEWGPAHSTRYVVRDFYWQKVSSQINQQLSAHLRILSVQDIIYFAILSVCITAVPFIHLMVFLVIRMNFLRSSSPCVHRRVTWVFTPLPSGSHLPAVLKTGIFLGNHGFTACALGVNRVLIVNCWTWTDARRNGRAVPGGAFPGALFVDEEGSTLV